jgi:hypothetical protein
MSFQNSIDSWTNRYTGNGLCFDELYSLLVGHSKWFDGGVCSDAFVRSLLVLFCEEQFGWCDASVQRSPWATAGVFSICF